MKKIGAITCNWNGERFIVPHLKMMTGIDRQIVIQGTAPWGDYKDEYGLSEKPDDSEKLVKDMGVEVYPACQNKFGPELYNQGLEILKDCDIVLRLDYDMFLTQKDWKRLIEFIRNTKWDCYLLNFNKCTINYYADFNHGLQNAREFDPIAFSPEFRLEKPFKYPYGSHYTIDWDDFLIHHFRGFKGKEIDVGYTEQRFKNVNWLKCPEEIREML